MRSYFVDPDFSFKQNPHFSPAYSSYFLRKIKRKVLVKRKNMKIPLTYILPRIFNANLMDIVKTSNLTFGTAEKKI